MLIDAHCHAHGFSRRELRRYKFMKIICVAEDFESSMKSLSLAEEFPNIIPFIGIHPWNVEEVSRSELENVIQLVEKRDDIRGLGEVGLDGKMKKTYEKQMEVFKRFCILASEYDLPMNIHARAAWREVLEILRKYDVEHAIIHWFSGPIELLEEIALSGYFITINPAVRIQERHRRVLEEASIEMILTESDGPYSYRGLNLRPDMIKDLVKYIAEVKGMREEVVEERIASNFRKLIR